MQTRQKQMFIDQINVTNGVRTSLLTTLCTLTALIEKREMPPLGVNKTQIASKKQLNSSLKLQLSGSTTHT